MTTATLRPNATIDAGGGIVTPGATGATNGDPYEVFADDSDASYHTSSEVKVALETVAMGSGSITKQVRVRWRGRSDSAVDNADAYVFLTPSTNNTSSYESSTVATPTLQTFTGIYTPLSISQAAVDDLSVWAFSAFGDVRWNEFYVDLVYVTQPSTSLTAVSPDPYTASSVVPVSWVNTLDSDGGAQTRYEVKVFTDAQYGAGGFDPATSTPYSTTGQVISSTTSVNVGPLPNDTYRAYVRVAQTVNGVSHWSAWAFDQFTLNVSNADVDTVTAVASNSTASIAVTVAWDNTSEGWEYIEVQRSIDAGATWADVRGATYVATEDSGATDFVVTDYEVANGQSVLYRARATWFSSGLQITGDWVQSSAVSWSSGVAWLKAPDDPTLNMVAQPGRISSTRTRRTGVFQVLGRKNPVVISDVRSGFGGTLPIYTDSAAEHADLKALLDGSAILLVQYPAAWDIDDAYVHVLGDGEDFASGAPLQLARTWPLSVVEIDAPADPDAGR